MRTASGVKKAKHRNRYHQTKHDAHILMGGRKAQKRTREENIKEEGREDRETHKQTGNDLGKPYSFVISVPID